MPSLTYTLHQPTDERIRSTTCAISVEITDACVGLEREDRGVLATAGSRRRRGSRIVRPGSARARAANQRIRAVVRADTPGSIPFFCECGLDYCHSSVWLTLQEARDLIESGGAIIGAHFFAELQARLGREARAAPPSASI